MAAEIAVAAVAMAADVEDSLCELGGGSRLLGEASFLNRKASCDEESFSWRNDLQQPQQQHEPQQKLSCCCVAAKRVRPCSWQDEDIEKWARDSEQQGGARGCQIIVCTYLRYG